MKEKLIEEIAKKIWAIHAFPRGATDWDRAVKQAEDIIARIGEAYVNGLPLPGEVGRDIVETFWVDDYLNDNVSVIGDLWPMLKRGDSVIALRKEGENEEK